MSRESGTDDAYQSGMQELDWLNGVFETVRCSGCGAVYGRGAIEVVGNRDEYWFVQFSCETCGAQGLGVVIVKETAEVIAGAPRSTTFRAPAFQVDDVLEAHELLRDYRGDMHGLF